MEGANISWDELICIEYSVTDQSVDKLCRDIRNYIISTVYLEEERVDQLLNWKILKKAEGKLLATTAFALLTSDYFCFAKIQCGVFEDIVRDEFIDKKDYTGPLYKQIKGAYQFVLRHINLNAKINVLVREKRYELPIDAIREMIINAQCHRNFMDNSCVQVAIYDDRLEATSPGMFYGGLTLEEAISIRPKIRNRAIGEVFSRMELIEEWGTGIRQILKRAEEYNLPKPEFLEIGNTFRVNLYRPTDKGPIEKADKSGTANADS